MADRTIYTFGDVRVDRGRMTVSRGAEAVPLEPKAFDVLLYLLEHRDRLVTKDELLDAAWAGTFVTPNVLTRAVAQIRKGLGDESREARYIETVAKRGYRFIAPVAVDQDQSATASVVGPPRAAPHHRISPRAMAISVAVVAIACAAGAGALFLRHAAGRELSIRRITNSGNVIDAIVSPDGNYVAYVEAERGIQTLYLRQIAGARPIELVPPAAVQYWGSVFSPDGQSIFYGLKTAAEPAGALFQVPVLGGTPRRILSRIDSGLTMSPDGSALAFYRVDAETGASSLVLAGVDGTNQRALVAKHPPEFLAPAFFAAPSWSPDGRRISAFVRNQDTKFVHLVTFDVASGAENAFGEPYRFASATLWARDGSGIFFVAIPPGTWASGTGGQIYFQPFPSGVPRHVTDDVAVYRNISVTADGHSLLSVASDFNSHLSIAPSAGGEERRISGARWDGLRGLAWMPDGNRILFGRPMQARQTLWSSAYDGGDARQLPIEGMSLWPAVSRDGRTLVFAGAFAGQSGIWRSAADGSARRLLAPTSNVSNVSLGPDGVVYFTSIAAGPPLTYRVGIEGGTAELLAPRFYAARVSHDGRMLAGLYRQSPDASATYAILDAHSGKMIRTLSDVSTRGGTTVPAWTPDDTAVLFTAVDSHNVWCQDLKGGTPRRITDFSDLTIFAFEPSPDGRTLLLARGTFTRDAYLIANVR